MDYLTFSLLLGGMFAATLILLRFSVVLAAYTKVAAQRATIENVKAEAELARAERLREIGHQGGRPRESQAPRKKKAGDDEEEEIEIDERLWAAAEGAGVDLKKALAGDRAELQKVGQMLMNGGQAAGQPAQQPGIL